VRQRALALAVSVTAGLAVTACGGHTATKRDVIARANAICVNALDGVRAVPPPTGGTNSPAALAGYLKKVVPIVSKEAADTRALPRPAQDKAILDRYVRAVSATAAQYRTLAAAAQRGDAGAVAQGLAALRTSPAPALAAQYGLARCSASAGSGVS
jgi:hypothetical protein